MQNRAMHEYAARRGWMIALQLREVGSGATQKQSREQLLEAARRRESDVVVVWRLDRWGRSVTDLLTTLQELEHLGVGFMSLTKALDLTTPAGVPWRDCSPCSRNSSRRFCGSELAPAWLTLGKAESGWAGLSRPGSRPSRCGNYTAPA